MVMEVDRSMWALAGTVVAIVVTALVMHIALVYQRRQKLPPGPWPWPVVGNLFAVYGKRPHKTLQSLAATYGSLMYLQLGDVPCLVVSTAAEAKEMFKTHDATFSSRPKSLVYTVLTAGTYRSLPVAPYGHYWRQLRRLVNTHLFSPVTHAGHECIRNGEVQNMMKHLVGEAQTGAPINVKQWLTGVTSNNITMMLTQNRYFDIRDENQEKRRYDDVLKRSIDANGALIISDYVPYLSFITSLQGWKAYLLELQKRGREMTGKIIEVNKHKQRAEAATKDDGYVPDMVDVLLKAPLDDTGKPLSDGEITSLLLSMINAGTDTTATTSEWVMAELMAHPDIRKQAQAEIDAVVGLNRVVQESDIPNLPLLQAIIKETLRLHPAAPLSVRRECLEPCVISGRWNLPAHTQLIFNIYAIHRDANVYENPDAFEPSRFLKHPEVNPLTGHDDFELMPFGVGRRMCPGANLAFTLASLMVTSLLHSFDWSLPDGENLDMREAKSFVLFKEKGLSLIATPRRPASLY